MISTLPDIAKALGSGRVNLPIIGEVRMLILVAAVTLLIGYLVLRYTRFGRYVYMTGASKTAARLAGVNTNVILTAVLTISGFTAGLAGIVSMGRLGSAQPDAVPSFLIDTIGAWVPGGDSPHGRAGRYSADRDRLADVPGRCATAWTIFPASTSISRNSSLGSSCWRRS